MVASAMARLCLVILYVEQPTDGCAFLWPHSPSQSRFSIGVNLGSKYRIWCNG